MQDRVPAPGKENRVRIRADDGQTIEGVLEYADDATVQGSAYSKANVLPDDLCNGLGIPTTSEPKDAFLAVHKKRWRELKRITSSQKWIVPDGVYQIGVFILGAGEGGKVGGGYGYDSHDDLFANGGCCGYVNNVILDVTPGQEFNVIIGSGGVGELRGASGGEGRSAAPEGDTSFGQYTAFGGNSTNRPKRFYDTQQSDDGIYLDSQYNREKYSTSASNGLPTISMFVSSASQDIVNWRPQNYCGNFFSIMSLLSSGGSCNAKGSGFAQKGTNTDLGHGGDSNNAGLSDSNNSKSYKAGDATGYGNGGGACFAATPTDTSSLQPTREGGKGSQGIVIIYV